MNFDLARIPLFAAATAAGALLPAQSLAIQDGNMRYSLGAPSATSHDPRAANLVADALGIDHLFEHWWYFRIDGDSRETSLRSIGPVRSGTTNGATHLDLDFDDLEQRGLLKARLDGDLYSAGPASGVVTLRLSLQNISNGPVTFDVFSYVDIDLAGTASNDYAIGDNRSQVVTDVTGVRIEHRAVGADVGQIGVYPALRNLLTNASVTNLTGVNTPINNGDFTGAFQWRSRTLGAGEWASFSTLLAVDTAANRPPEAAAYGIGSSTSLEIHTDGLLLQNNAVPRSVDVLLRSGPPNELIGLLSNFLPLPGLPFLGATIWVDLNPPAQFPIRHSDGNGEARYTFAIPPSPYLTGIPVYHQFFVSNLLAPNGLADFTAALSMTVGKL